MVEALITIGLFVAPFVLYYGIRSIAIDVMSRRLIKDALQYGIYDSIWACREKYYVTDTRKYNEYILTSEKTKEQIVISKEHLWDNLKHSSKKLPEWTIAYPGSKPAELKINNNNK